uniref:Anillin n=1 Tax=Sparus aurata TaxID=8175 RepID=A0A671WEI3_SPAAU
MFVIFKQKLLERTRARRENLQKKIAERPNAASRGMVKRPLADTNSMTSEPVFDKVPQPSSKPSPSKRSRSGENLQPAAGEENQKPVLTTPIATTLTDPPTDKKPPAGPASIRSSSSLEKTATRHAVQSQPQETKTAQPESKEKAVTPAPDPLSSRETEMVSAISAPQRNKEDLVEDAAPSAVGMRSRLQRLAEQRKGWDGSATSDAGPDYTSISQLKRQDVVPPSTVPTVSSGTPLGRRGRLANLAATIGSWEDDLSHANIVNQNPKEKPGTAMTKVAVRDAAVATSTKPGAASSTASSEATSSSNQQAMNHPGKSSRVVVPSPQKVDIPATKPALKPASSPQKSSIQGTAFPSSPQKATPSSSALVPQSPLKNQPLSRGLNTSSSPQKPGLHAKPIIAASSTPQEKATGGASGKSYSTVKSFLERFGEKCQERTNQSSAAGSTANDKILTVTPSVTPNTRLVQERLRAAQAANTATADLTQRQKSESLSWLRSAVAFRKGATCHELMVSPPVSTSSPLRVVTPNIKKTTDETPKDGEMVKEIEMNVDRSIDSAVINGLFEGILEQSDDQNEEEDALNISSMSLLAPLAETVAAVVKSPEKRMMTSTPASSFIVKSNTPDKPSKFQRSNIVRTASSDSSEASDEDLRLPYSIDAYRSTRVKDTERPGVKQVIVRKEDVSQRAEEPRGSSLFSIKQKMKILTNEMNLQQTVIHQASQALNCCTDEEHGKGSQVEAEAQRLLLVATERRKALMAELDRLKGDPTGQKSAPAAPEPTCMSASKGSITLQELRLPLKADFVCSTANKPESTKYSFFVMIRAGAENTVATPLASTHRGLSGDTLAFPTTFTISDVSSNFEIDIEVYGLVSVLHHVLASPGGPNAVRTSNFVLVASHKLTLSCIGKNKFPLEKVPFLCPLEGHIYLKMQCEVGSKVEGKGFLTMFEDVSGFGAWHRRWCVLSGYCISYWTYPDDEKRKNPIGRINLANCTSNKVEPANREFCARPHTFELITVRPQREDDKETLVSQCQNTMCVTKNWLSADTKDERNLWMKKLNQILVDLRMWQPEACYRPL